MISQAFAQTAAVAGSASMTSTIVQLIAIFAIFYFILIRPQQKAMKNHQAMINATKKGDKVVTGGGIVAKVISASDDEVEVEIAKDVVVKVKKSTLKDVIGAKENETKPVKKAKK